MNSFSVEYQARKLIRWKFSSYLTCCCSFLHCCARRWCIPAFLPALVRKPGEVSPCICTPSLQSYKAWFMYIKVYACCRGYFRELELPGLPYKAPALREARAYRHLRLTGWKPSLSPQLQLPLPPNTSIVAGMWLPFPARQWECLWTCQGRWCVEGTQLTEPAIKPTGTWGSSLPCCVEHSSWWLLLSVHFQILEWTLL